MSTWNKFFRRFYGAAPESLSDAQNLEEAKEEERCLMQEEVERARVRLNHQRAADAAAQKLFGYDMAELEAQRQSMATQAMHAQFEMQMAQQRAEHEHQLKMLQLSSQPQVSISPPRYGKSAFETKMIEELLKAGVDPANIMQAGSRVGKSGLSDVVDPTTAPTTIRPVTLEMRYSGQPLKAPDKLVGSFEARPQIRLHFGKTVLEIDMYENSEGLPWITVRMYGGGFASPNPSKYVLFEGEMNYETAVFFRRNFARTVVEEAGMHNVTPSTPDDPFYMSDQGEEDD